LTVIVNIIYKILYEEFALIVDSLWLYPILGFVFLAILYWFD